MMRVALSPDRFNARQPPQSIEYLLANAPDAERREQVRPTFASSAMDVIDRFFPDKIKHMELRANLAFAANHCVTRHRTLRMGSRRLSMAWR